MTTAERIAPYTLRRLIEENEAIRAQAARLSHWESAIGAVMMPDLKDWHDNDPKEWPDVAAAVIRTLREQRDEEVELSGRLSAENEALRAKNEELTGKTDDLTAKSEELRAQVEALKKVADSLPWYDFGTRPAVPNPITVPEVQALPLMFNSFRTTRAYGLSKCYEMVFAFRSIEDLHAADDEWSRFRRAAPQPQPTIQHLPADDTEGGQP